MGFAMQYLSGTAINGSYFFEQGESRHAGPRLTRYAAGLNPANAFKLNLGSTAMGLCGTFLAWFSLTVGFGFAASGDPSQSCLAFRSAQDIPCGLAGRFHLVSN